MDPGDRIRTGARHRRRLHARCRPARTAPGGKRAPGQHGPDPGGARRRLRDPVRHRRPAGRAPGRRLRPAAAGAAARPERRLRGAELGGRCARGTAGPAASISACSSCTSTSSSGCPTCTTSSRRICSSPACCWCASPIRSATAFAGRSTSTTSCWPPTSPTRAGSGATGRPRRTGPSRLTIAATMYLLGIYLAFTGLVSERLRSRVRQAMHTARELVDSLEQKQRALEVAGARSRGGAPPRRAGQRRQGAVPGDHQPRDPHADERHPRHHRAAARHAARRRPAPSRRDRATSRRPRCWR